MNSFDIHTYHYHTYILEILSKLELQSTHILHLIKSLKYFCL